MESLRINTESEHSAITANRPPFAFILPTSRMGGPTPCRCAAGRPDRYRCLLRSDHVKRSTEAKGKTRSQKCVTNERLIYFQISVAEVRCPCVLVCARY